MEPYGSSASLSGLEKPRRSESGLVAYLRRLHRANAEEGEEPPPPLLFLLAVLLLKVLRESEERICKCAVVGCALGDAVPDRRQAAAWS